MTDFLKTKDYYFNEEEERDGEEASQVNRSKAKGHESRSRNRRDTSKSKSRPGPASSKIRARASPGSDDPGKIRDCSESGRHKKRETKRKTGKNRQPDPSDPSTDLDDPTGRESLVDSLDSDSDREVEVIDPQTVNEERERNPWLTPGLIEDIRGIMSEAEVKVAQYVSREDCPPVGMDYEEGKRGRRPETGEFYIKQLLEAKKQLVQAAQELKATREAVPPAELSNDRIIAEQRIKEELSYQPTKTLPAIILEAVNKVDYVVQKSKNIKGGYIGKLNESAATIKVALTQLIQRYDRQESDYEKDAEMERLRIKISAQEKEIEALRNLQTQYAQLQKEAQEQRKYMELMQEQIKGGNVERTTRLGRDVRGTKKRKYLPLPPSS